MHGIALGSTSWLKALGDGLHEFRVRHDAATIEALAGQESVAEFPTQKQILLLTAWKVAEAKPKNNQGKKWEPLARMWFST